MRLVPQSHVEQGIKSVMPLLVAPRRLHSRVDEQIGQGLIASGFASECACNRPVCLANWPVCRSCGCLPQALPAATHTHTCRIASGWAPVLKHSYVARITGRGSRPTCLQLGGGSRD